MDISTPEGMRAAVEWQTRHVGMLNDGGIWLVPRSNTIIHINHGEQIATFDTAGSEPDIRNVFLAMGWAVMNKSQEN